MPSNLFALQSHCFRLIKSTRCTVLNRAYRMRHTLFGHQNSTVSNVPPKACFNLLQKKSFTKFSIKVSICNATNVTSEFERRYKRTRLLIWAKLNEAMTMDRSSKKIYMNNVTIYISVAFMRLTLLSLNWSLSASASSRSSHSNAWKLIE